MEDTEMSNTEETKIEGSFSACLQGIRLLKTCVNNVVFSAGNSKTISDEVLSPHTIDCDFLCYE